MSRKLGTEVVCGGVILAVAIAAPSPLRAWNEAEHVFLAGSAFAAVRAECPALEATVSFEPDSLAALSARSSEDDLSPARHHLRARTPLDQLRELTKEQIQKALASRAGGPGGGGVPVADNVVANYLIRHLIALHLAAQSDTPFSVALESEAIAIGYLADSFSAAHMFLPIHLKLAPYQQANIRAAHQFFAGEGAYVLNAKGDAWQSFGDGMLRWYVPTQRRVLAACRESIREVHLVRAVRAGGFRPGETFRSWADSVAAPGDWEAVVEEWLRIESGGFFFEEIRLPALLSIPIPVAASWSVRTSSKGEFGTARRHHFPQLREPGGHDPNDGALDPRFLPPRTAVPGWMIPEALERTGPLDLIRNDPGIASVHYVQTRDFHPSLAGATIRAGGGVLLGAKGGGTVSVAAGYAWEFPLPLGAARTALELEWYRRLGDSERRALAPYVLLGLGFPSALLDSAHFKLGYAWGLRSPLDEDGYAWGVGVATPALQFPFTYAGVSLRVGYQQFRLENALDGFEAHLVLQ